MAGRALLASGHKRIAFIAHQCSDATIAYRTGLEQVMRAGGGVVPEQFVEYGDARRRKVAEKREWMRPVLERICLNSDRPSAIMTDFDPQAELAFFLLQELGLEVPRDVSLIGFGGAWREGAMLERLTAVTVDEGELGRLAVKLLGEMRNGTRPLDDNEEFVMPLSLAEGGTLGPARTKCEDSFGSPNRCANHEQLVEPTD
jgi:LacI family transcriptional regulator